MIMDRMEHLGLYRVPVEGLDEARAWLEDGELPARAPGRYPLGDSGAVAILADGFTVPAEEEEWEAHRRFADLQVVLSGIDLMGFAALSEMTPTGEYSAEDDCPLLEGTGNFVRVGRGSFVLFTPHDAHKAMLAGDSGPARVRKVVFKLPWKG